MASDGRRGALLETPPSPNHWTQGPAPLDAPLGRLTWCRCLSTGSAGVMRNPVWGMLLVNIIFFPESTSVCSSCRFLMRLRRHTRPGPWGDVMGTPQATGEVRARGSLRWGCYSGLPKSVPTLPVCQAVSRAHACISSFPLETHVTVIKVRVPADVGETYA